LQTFPTRKCVRDKEPLKAVKAMASIDDVTIEITPLVLLKAYACGIFPMAESAEDNALYWIEPERRGILPLNRVHVPKRLARTIRQGGFEVKIDNDFDAVIEGCAAPRAGRRSTWINGRIRSLYRELFAMGHCHTVEVWQDDKLIGGLYGVHLGRAFFGESMFSRARDASKIALVYLVARLKYGGFELLDTQFVTDHLAKFGVIEVTRAEFQRSLEGALGGGVGLGFGLGLATGGGAGSAAAGGAASAAGAASGAGAAGAPPGAAAFASLGAGVSGVGVLQLVSQTSKTGCSTALSPGLSANIQPVKMR
jgi:leucyl/phenylalanyl-tRNA--protein transferase